MYVCVCMDISEWACVCEHIYIYSFLLLFLCILSIFQAVFSKSSGRTNGITVIVTRHGLVQILRDLVFMLPSANTQGKSVL